MQSLLPYFFAIFLMLGAYWVSGEMELVSDFEINSWSEDHMADCGVVLTGGPGRVRDGFALLARGQVKKLIISGVNPGASLREIFPEWPIYGDLSEDDVVLEKRSGTTFGNAQQSLVLVEALHCKNAVVVTSGLHMYRAKRTFNSVFPDEFPLEYRAVHPGASGLDYFSRLVEAVKSIFYSLWVY